MDIKRIFYLALLLLTTYSCIDKHQEVYYVTSGPHKPRLFSIPSIIADSQIKYFNKNLKGKLDTYSAPNSNATQFVFKRSILADFFKKYADSTNFNYVRIKLVEIDPSVNDPYDYYKKNAKKIHLLFYAADTTHKKLIDSVAYDLTEGVSISSMHTLSKVDEGKFDTAFRNGIKYTLNSINSTYNNKPCLNTGFIYVEKEDFEKLITMSFTNFDKLIIKLSLYYGSYNGTEIKLKGKDNLLNLLFYRAKSDNTILSKSDVYDMNDLCPPGNCFGME
ncbi:MAG: hypothetical protein R2831_01995 [Chitinophagaceae bacterium]